MHGADGRLQSEVERPEVPSFRDLGGDLVRPVPRGRWSMPGQLRASSCQRSSGVDDSTPQNGQTRHWRGRSSWTLQPLDRDRRRCSPGCVSLSVRPRHREAFACTLRETRPERELEPKRPRASISASDSPARMPAPRQQPSAAGAGEAQAVPVPGGAHGGARIARGFRPGRSRPSWPADCAAAASGARGTHIRPSGPAISAKKR